jgi:glycosyltransferase involved in cell wall biosynthesis
MHVSIVLPTHNRAAILQRTLDLYGQQIGPKDDFEVIVVDDASVDATPAVVDQARRVAPYQIVAHRLEANSGPSRARNLALGLARGDIILFSGDDMLPAPDFVAQHRDWHIRHPEERAAMVGRIVWAQDLDTTALLRWLETMGTQFHYGDMQDGGVVQPDRFYTSNASVKRAFLERTGQRLDERMRFCEDSEFAMRLARLGMTLHYHAAARAEHLHPTDLASSLRRMRALGQAVAAMQSTSPETFARVTAGVLDRSAGWRGRLVRAALSAPLRRLVYEPLASLCERRVFADRIFALAHAANMLEGVRRGHGDVTP